MNGAHKNQSGNWVVPNSFQTPNLIVDKLMYYLTPSEVVALIFAIRQILGYQDKIANRRANISISVFEHSGLGYGAIRSALNGLNQYGILKPVGKPTEDGQLYELQENEEKIDWIGLTKRREERDQKQAQKTASATAASLASRSVTLDVTTQEGNDQRNPPVTSNVTGGVTSNVNIKTHLNPPIKPKDIGAGAPPPKPNEKPKKPEKSEALKITATHGGRILHALIEVEFSAKGRNTPEYFPSVACRDKFLTNCEQRLNGTLKEAITRALQKGIMDIPGIVDFTAKYGLSNGTGKPAAPAAPPVDTMAEYEQTKIRTREMMRKAREAAKDGANAEN